MVARFGLFLGVRQLGVQGVCLVFDFTGRAIGFEAREATLDDWVVSLVERLFRFGAHLIALGLDTGKNGSGLGKLVGFPVILGLLQLGLDGRHIGLDRFSLRVPRNLPRQGVIKSIGRVDV